MFIFKKTERLTPWECPGCENRSKVPARCAESEGKAHTHIPVQRNSIPLA